LAQGVIGTMTGLGAAASTTVGGYMSDHFGSQTAFLGLGGIAAVALIAVLVLMPETQENRRVSAVRPVS